MTKGRGFKVKYYDDDGCEQQHVPAELIRRVVKKEEWSIVFG